MCDGGPEQLPSEGHEEVLVASEQSAAVGGREQPSREARGASREAMVGTTSSTLCGYGRVGIHRRAPRNSHLHRWSLHVLFL